jgi:4-hydroxy-tetrahydrodipicolinate synthase
MVKRNEKILAKVRVFRKEQIEFKFGYFDVYPNISVDVYQIIPENDRNDIETLIKDLDETEYVMGVKQSVGGVQALYAMKMMCQDKGRIYAATDDMLFTCYDLGACGAISAILSVFPEQCVEMWNNFKAGNKARAFEIQNQLYDKWQCLGGNQFPIRLKYALEILGREPGLCRSPITYLPEDEKAKIKEAFTK